MQHTKGNRIHKNTKNEPSNRIELEFGGCIMANSVGVGLNL